MSVKYRKTLQGYSLSSQSKKIKANRRAQSRNLINRRKKRKIKTFFIGLLVIFIFSLIIYFLFYSEYTQIKKINLIKTIDYKLISEQEFKQKIGDLMQEKRFIFSSKNIISFKTKKLEELI